MKITDLYGIHLYCMVWYSRYYVYETKYDFLNIIKSQFLCLVYGPGFRFISFLVTDLQQVLYLKGIKKEFANLKNSYPDWINI